MKIFSLSTFSLPQNWRRRSGCEIKTSRWNVSGPLHSCLLPVKKQTEISSDGEEVGISKGRRSSAFKWEKRSCRLFIKLSFFKHCEVRSNHNLDVQGNVLLTTKLNNYLIPASEFCYYIPLINRVGGPVNYGPLFPRFRNLQCGPRNEVSKVFIISLYLEIERAKTKF